tara:strand:+ start:667 stop:1329 length:663 start_codon:yes stop_codon:yes gene_type:complete
MFKDLIQSQVIGTLKIYDKDSGDILVQKKNAIHPGNMAYVLASALANKLTSVGGNNYINWMQFGNDGSVSSTTLSYKSPRVNSTYDTLDITASNSSLYAPTYEQRILEDDRTVLFPGINPGGVEVPNNTAKVNFSVDISHAKYQAAVILNGGGSIPSNDSSTDDNYTFDEIGLLAGVTDNGGTLLLKEKTLMLTHVTFHPVLLSANRTIVIDYTITIQIS